MGILVLDMAGRNGYTGVAGEMMPLPRAYERATKMSFVTQYTTKSLKLNILQEVVEAYNASHDVAVTAVPSHTTAAEGNFGFAYAPNAAVAAEIEALVAAYEVELAAFKQALDEVADSFEEVVEERKWTVYDACAVIEGFDGQDHDEEEQIEAFQFLIDTGVAWSLQGFYGRAAAGLIEAGLCHPATSSERVKLESVYK